MMAEPGKELQLITKLKGSLSRISGREWLTGNVSHDSDKNDRMTISRGTLSPPPGKKEQCGSR